MMTSVATARPAATVRPGAAARVATAAARPSAPLRARLAVPRAQVLVHASARLPAVAAARSRSPLGFAVRLASPVRRGRRGGSLVAGGAEKSSSAETSTAAESDDVDALAERLDKLKEKSRAMLAEAEALEKSAKASASGASAVMNRQREMLQKTMQEVTEMAHSFRAPGNPQEMMAKQADFAKRSFEAAVKNAGEMSELVKKSSADSIEILRARIRESMEEIRQGYEKRK